VRRSTPLLSEGWGDDLQGREVASEGSGEREMCAPTTKEMRAFDQALLRLKATNAGKVNPKALSEGQAVAMRAQLAKQLFKLDRDLADEVRAGSKTPAQADKEYKRAEARMVKLAEMLKPGAPQQPERFDEGEDGGHDGSSTKTVHVWDWLRGE